MKKVLSAMGILLAAGAARAMIETLPLSRLVEAADVVAVCETVEQTQRSVPADATPAIRHVLKPVEVLQARIEPGTTITLETLGTLDGKTWVEDEPNIPARGRKALYFLQQAKNGRWTTVNSVQGAWPIDPGSGKLLGMGTGTTLAQVKAEVARSAGQGGGQDAARADQLWQEAKALHAQKKLAEALVKCEASVQLKPVPERIQFINDLKQLLAGKLPDLSGKWESFQDNRKVVDCAIEQDGTQLAFIIRRTPQVRSAGTFENRGTVVAADWGPLKATVFDGGNRLDWGESEWVRNGAKPIGRKPGDTRAPWEGGDDSTIVHPVPPGGNGQTNSSGQGQQTGTNGITGPTTTGGEDAWILVEIRDWPPEKTSEQSGPYRKTRKYDRKEMYYSQWAIDQYKVKSAHAATLKLKTEPPARVGLGQPIEITYDWTATSTGPLYIGSSISVIFDLPGMKIGSAEATIPLVDAKGVKSHSLGHWDAPDRRVAGNGTRTVSGPVPVRQGTMPAPGKRWSLYIGLDGMKTEYVYEWGGKQSGKPIGATGSTGTGGGQATTGSADTGKDPSGDWSAIVGEWKIIQHGIKEYPGKLQIMAKENGLSGRIWFDVYGRWEEIRDIQFNATTGELAFYRPEANQKHQAVLSNGRLSGAFGGKWKWEGWR